MGMKNYVNWAILAPGKVANAMGKAMSESSKTHEDIKLYAVASRSKVRAENFARQWGFKKAYGSYEDLYKDPNVDAVYVANPHSLHYETVMNLLTKGKHVLCEKPAGCNVDQLIEMMEVAHNRNLFFMEAMWTAFSPTLRAVRNYIDRGKIGNLLNIESKFCIRVPFDKNSRLWNPDLGGGALLDLGIYCIYFAMFMNHFKGIEYFNSDVRLKNNVDAWNCISLKFSNHVTSAFQSAIDIASDEKTNTATIYGTKGFITMKNFFMPEEASIYVFDSEEGFSNKLTDTIKYPFSINGYEYELYEATKQILAGSTESNVYTHTDSIYLAAIMNDIRQQWNFKYPFEY